jgi:hypothetical protein
MNAHIRHAVAVRDKAALVLLLMATRDCVQNAYGITAARLDEWKAAARVNKMPCPRRSPPALFLQSVEDLLSGAPAPVPHRGGLTVYVQAFGVSEMSVCLNASVHRWMCVCMRVSGVCYTGWAPCCISLWCISLCLCFA